MNGRKNDAMPPDHGQGKKLDLKVAQDRARKRTNHIIVGITDSNYDLMEENNK